METYKIVALPYGQSSEIIRAANINNFRKLMALRYEGTSMGFEVWKIYTQEDFQFLGTIQAVNYSGTMYWNDRRFSLKTGRLL